MSCWRCALAAVGTATAAIAANRISFFIFNLLGRCSTNGRNRYVAPIRNWNYRRVSVGYRLQPAFYGSRYYINDYGAYNLQAPHGRWLRWIRYGDDLLLVNIRTGRVLNVVHYRGW